MKKETKKRRRRGPPKGIRYKHGGYSLALRDELIKKTPGLRRYLEDSRTGLVRDVAGGEAGLSEPQRIMIDRIISRLSITRMIEIYIAKYGIFRKDRIKREGILELEPALGINYLAFSNSIDRALVNLGLEKRRTPVKDVLTFAAEFDAQQAKEEARQARKAVKKGAVQRQAAQDALSPETPGEGAGDPDGAPGGENDDKGGDDDERK